MKNRFIIGAAALGLALALCGCEPLYREEQINYKELALAEMAGGNYDKAVSYLNDALALCNGKISSTEVELNYYKGAALFSQGAYDDAIQCYTSLINYNGSFYEPYFLRGCVYIKKEDVANATKDFDRAVELDPQNYDLYIKIFDILANDGHEAMAYEVINKALALLNDKADGYLARGQIYFYLDDYAKAEVELKNAISKGAKEAKVYLAKVYEATGDQAQAKQILTEYVNDGGADVEALCSLGDMALAAGKYKEALDYYQSGIVVDDNSEKMGLYRGEIAALEFLGQFKEAKLKMSEYLKKYPSDAEAAREMIFLQTR